MDRWPSKLFVAPYNYVGRKETADNAHSVDMMVGRERVDVISRGPVVVPLLK